MHSYIYIYIHVLVCRLHCSVRAECQLLQLSCNPTYCVTITTERERPSKMKFKNDAFQFLRSTSQKIPSSLTKFSNIEAAHFCRFRCLFNVQVGYLQKKGAQLHGDTSNKKKGAAHSERVDAGELLRNVNHLLVRKDYIQPLSCLVMEAKRGSIFPKFPHQMPQKKHTWVLSHMSFTCLATKLSCTAL